jgi:hypothetical protein
MRASTIPALFILAGLVNGAGAAGPVPTHETAVAQLRAINHRFLNTRIDPGGKVIDALTHEDFVFTASDGAWKDRAHFVAQVGGQAPRDSASLDDLRVRLFGRVALVHGVFTGPGEGGAAARLRFTDVYVWSGAAWQLVSAQETPLKASVGVALQAGTAPAHAPWRGQDPVGDDDRILHVLNERYVQAFRESDVAWYDAHLATDYVVASSDGSLRDRAVALAAFAQPTFATAMKSFPVGKVNVRRFDDVALIHAENAYELKDGRTGISRYTDIWFKRDGRWLCIAAHITTHKAPGP